MPAHVLFAVDKHGPAVEPGGLEGTEGPLDLGEPLVGGHRLVSVDGPRIQTGADDVEAVEAGLGLDLALEACSSLRMSTLRRAEIQSGPARRKRW